MHIGHGTRKFERPLWPQVTRQRIAQTLGLIDQPMERDGQIAAACHDALAVTKQVPTLATR